MTDINLAEDQARQVVDSLFQQTPLDPDKYVIGPW